MIPRLSWDALTPLVGHLAAHEPDEMLVAPTEGQNIVADDAHTAIALLTVFGFVVPFASSR